MTTYKAENTDREKLVDNDPLSVAGLMAQARGPTKKRIRRTAEPHLSQGRGIKGAQNTAQFNEDIFELALYLTPGCPCSCGHCYLSCAPGKLRYHLTLDEVKSVLKDAAKARVKFCNFTGGEPFMFPAVLLPALDYALTLGFKITVRTSGFWASSDSITDKVMRFLKDRDIQLGLSYDKFHEEFIPEMYLYRLLYYVDKYNLRCWFDWVGDGSPEEAANVFKKFSVYSRYLKYGGNIDIFRPIGRARFLASYYRAKPLDWYEFNSYYSFACRDRHILEYYPGGFTRFDNCCLAPLFIFKKPASKGWIEEIVRNSDANPAVELLEKEGVGGLVRLARKSPVISKEAERKLFYSDCMVCMFLLPRLFDSKYLGAPSSGFLFDEDKRSATRRFTILLSHTISKGINRWCPEV